MDAEVEADIQRAMPTALKMALYTAKKQSYEIEKYALESIESLSNNAGLLKDHADPEHIAALEATTKEFILLDAQLHAYKMQLQKMEASIESGKVDMKDFDKLIKSSTAKPKVNPTKHERYKRFCEQAGIELEQDADADVVFQESESTRSTICPVTQMEITKPLKNRACGHTYSEQGIRSHLQRKKNCPVAGCPHRLTFDSLERDVEMELLIERRKNTASSQHAGAAPSFRDDDDDDEEEYVVE